MNAIEIDQVANKVKLSQSTIYGMIAEGKFPRPFALLGTHPAWLVIDIDQWLETRAAERNSNDYPLGPGAVMARLRHADAPTGSATPKNYRGDRPRTSRTPRRAATFRSTV